MAVRSARSRFWRSSLCGQYRYEEVTDYVQSAKMRVDVDAAHPWSIDIQLSDPVLAEWSGLSVDMELTSWDGMTETTESGQVGHFVVFPPTQVHVSHSGAWVYAGNDLTWFIAQDEETAGFSLAAGTNIVTAVKDVIGGCIATAALSIPQNGRTLASARSWEPQTSKMTIVNELLNAMGYRKLMQRRNGQLVSNPLKQLDEQEPARTYSSADGDVSYSVGLDSSPDQMWNAVSIVKTLTDQDVIAVRVQNDRTDSPISTVNLGFVKMHRVITESVETEADALSMALNILELGSTFTQRLELYVPPNIDFEPGEVVALDIVRDDGYVVADGNWWWDEMDIDLRPMGPQRLRVNKMVPWRSDPVTVMS